MTIEKLESKITDEMQDKWWGKFEKYSRYMGNGVYEIQGILSTDTRELFLLYVAFMEKLTIKIN